MTIARYSTSNGLAGCYTPDNTGGPVICTTRRELASWIRDEIEYLDWPKSMFAEVGIRRLWSHIVRHGSSVAHFSLQRNGYELAFYGLTEDEANAMESEA